MPTNFIKIFDDTVIKLSVNQGLEEQRVSETLGTFTTGELAFTRDSGRLFVGDNSDGEPTHKGIQETIGGTLVGNKYLGLIDSKPLVTFSHNAKALSYEAQTTATGTQDKGNMIEQGLLTKDSKFRLHSAADAAEVWDNWDRYSTYNPKYNAYNGDYMFDIYENALILFDNRISGDPNSSTQPQIKMGENGLPVEPETFIYQGKEIPSTSTDALKLTRRTKLQNYIKVNDEETNSQMIYGDGYVMIRIVEPDNQTIRFKTRSFQNNGLPEVENNYTHNILEVFHIPLSAFQEYFSDDFFISDDLVWLTKDIKYVKSITGDGGVLKLPTTLAFARPKSGGRGATSYMEWHFNDPTGVVPFPSDNRYKLILTPTQKKTDSGQEFLHFEANLEEEGPKPPYYVRLTNGIECVGTHPSLLIIDKNATGDDPTTYPTLTLNLDNEIEASQWEVMTNPYNISEEYSWAFDVGYTDNLGFNKLGRLQLVDHYASAYYSLAQDKIDKWEEEATSINYLKTPVTIAQTDTRATLYGNLANFENHTGMFNTNNPALTVSTTVIGKSVDKLVSLTSAVNTMVAAFNSGTATAAYKPTWVNHVLTVPNDTANTSGVGIVVTSSTIGTPRENKSFILKGQVSGVNSLSTSKRITVFAGLVNNGKLMAKREVQGYCNNLSFEIDLEMDCVTASGTSYLVWGLICDQVGSQITCTITDQILAHRGLSQDNVFQVSNASINAYLDYKITPYLYCDKKVITCPNNMLPAYTAPAQSPLNSSTTYFDTFASNASYTKTWNHLFMVLGHNFNTSLKTYSSTSPMYKGTSDIKKAAFLSIAGMDKTEANDILVHTDATPDLAGYMVFCWYKYYTKAADGAQSNILYCPAEDFEIRGSYVPGSSDSAIDVIRIQGTNTNLIDGSAAGVTVGTTEEQVDIATNRYRIMICIYPESDLLNSVPVVIEYGKNGQQMYQYDLRNYKSLSLKHDIPFVDVSDVVCIKADKTKVTIAGTAFTKTSYSIEENIPSDPVSKFSDYKWVIVNHASTDYAGTADLLYASIYRIIPSVPYLQTYGVPGTLPATPVWSFYTDTDDTWGVLSRPVNEAIQEADRVYIPTTARNIILQVTHNTTENNTVALFYSNNYNDLGWCVSGLPTKQWSNPTAFTNDIVLNPSQDESYSVPSTEGKYADKATATAATYTHRLGKSFAENASMKFHSLTATLEENKKSVPNIFQPNVHERCLMLSSASETRVIEIPLHPVPNSTNSRHFCLRVAGIRPSSNEVLNEFVIRVIGYRV